MTYISIGTKLFETRNIQGKQEEIKREKMGGPKTKFLRMIYINIITLVKMYNIWDKKLDIFLKSYVFQPVCLL